MTNKPKKILITGCSGMLGSALTKMLAPEYEIIGIDIDTADITNKTQIITKITSINPDTIIHAAAYAQVDNCENDKEQAFAVNATGSENVAIAAKLCQAKMIYISTDYVFDGKKTTPYLEEDITNPINIYGKSKLEGEKRIQAACKNHLIIRTAWLYGPNGKNFVTTILKLADQQKEIKVVNDQTGCPTLTLDLAAAIKSILTKDIRGTLNITNSGSCTWYELAKKILELKNKTVNVIPIDSNQLNYTAPRPTYTVLNTNKFIQLTKSTIRPWGKALTDYLAIS